MPNPLLHTITGLFSLRAGVLVLTALFLTGPFQVGRSLVTAQTAPDVVRLDARALELYPDVIMRIAMTNISRRADGLIGRNAQWDGFYASRFQMGAGYSLRIALAANQPDLITRAFQTVMAGINPIRDDGSVPADVPDALRPSPDARPSAGDIASGAAFFLGDACLGIAALRELDTTGIVAPEDVDHAINRLTLAVDWLAGTTDLLEAADRLAPNRLLFDARAFQACSLLEADPARSQAIARDFVNLAVALMHPDGYFIEGGGWDTSYQAVALAVGNDILAAGYADPDGLLRSTLGNAADWLTSRIDDEGRVDSSGNTRTCWGQETFLGEDKSLPVVDVIGGLIYRALDTGNQAWFGGADRVIAWAIRTDLQVDPCFGSP